MAMNTLNVYLIKTCGYCPKGTPTDLQLKIIRMTKNQELKVEDVIEAHSDKEFLGYTLVATSARNRLQSPRIGSFEVILQKIKNYIEEKIDCDTGSQIEVDKVNLIGQMPDVRIEILSQFFDLYLPTKGILINGKDV